MEALTTMGALAVTEAIKELSKKMASFVTEKVSKYYKDTTNKEMIDAGWAFETYLEKVYETYSKSKSILYESEARELSSFFEPVDLKLRSEHHFSQPAQKNANKNIGNGVRFSSKEIDKILTRKSKKLIVGSGGTGKTILMKHFCTAAIKTGHGIPAFISLRWFNNMEIGDEPFEKLIYEQLKVFRFELEYEYFKYSLEGDRYIFLFDGFDEISREKRSLITEKLYNFSRRYGDNCFIITSREIEEILGWDSFAIYEICPLGLEQAVRLIRRIDFDMQSRTRFVQELYNGLYNKYRSFTSVPLLLSLLFITFVEKTVIPESLQRFYEEAFETMLYRRDKKKVGLNRVLESKLSYEVFREVFMCFCFMTYINDEYSFLERRLIECISEAAKKTKKQFDAHAYFSDLRDIACMLIRDGNEFTFLHRSFQEYFAAYYTSLRSDDKQKLFCSALINQADMVFTGSKRFRPMKAVEFLRMLRQVEPQRYESIVILPILEKLYRLKQECDGNLSGMVSSCFYVKAIDNADEHFCIYYYIFDDKKDSLISYYEFYILFDFYSESLEEGTNALLGSISLEEGTNALLGSIFTIIRRSLFEDLGGQSETIVSSAQQLVVFGYYTNYKPCTNYKNEDMVKDTYRMLSSIFDKCLKRYDEFVSQNATQDKLEDLLYDF